MYTYDEFNSADPSSMQGTCHIWTLKVIPQKLKLLMN